MAKSQRDIEYEMSRFEEEITKLTPVVPHVISAAPVSNLTIKPRSLGNLGMPSSFSAFGYQQPIPHNPFMNQPMQNTYIKPQPMVTKSVADQSTSVALKRDSSGNVIQKGVPSSAATSSAQAGKTLEPDAKKVKDNKGAKKSKFVRAAGGQVWVDETLAEWNPDDFRLFCGDLGNEVNDESLSRAFQKYPSFQKGKVVRDKKTGKTKGYGFVSFRDSNDFIKAMREMNGKYVGNRPIKLRKSNWSDRNIDQVKKKQTEKEKMGLR